MTPSVSPEADCELTDAREGGAELGFAFVAEFERGCSALRVSEVGCGVAGGTAFPYSIIYYLEVRSCGWWPTRITGDGLAIGAAALEVALGERRAEAQQRRAADRRKRACASLVAALLGGR